MHIGLISDTHGFLDESVFTHFAVCDEIWHAGDIGSMEIVSRLEAFKPFRAVYGNIDDRSISTKFPEDLWFTCEGLMVWMTHIGGRPPSYNPRVKKKLVTSHPGLFVCGHSHMLRVEKDNKYELLYVNPGAAGNQGLHHVRTIMRLQIDGGKVRNPEVIELGRRGAIP